MHPVSHHHLQQAAGCVLSGHVPEVLKVPVQLNSPWMVTWSGTTVLPQVTDQSSGSKWSLDVRIFPQIQLAKTLGTTGRLQLLAIVADIWWHHGVACSPVMASSHSSEQRNVYACVKSWGSILRSLWGVYRICNMRGVNLGGPEVPSDLKHLLSKLDSSKMVC